MNNNIVHEFMNVCITFTKIIMMHQRSAIKYTTNSVC